MSSSAMQFGKDASLASGGFQLLDMVTTRTLSSAELVGLHPMWHSNTSRIILKGAENI